MPPDDRNTDASTDRDRVVYNGIDGETGAYLFAPSTVATVDDPIAAPLTPGAIARARNAEQRHLGLPFGIAGAVPAQAGWCLIAPEGKPERFAAVAQLVRRRAGQVPPDRLKQLTVAPGQSAAVWLQKQRVGAGVVMPTRVPFYVLLLGSPAEIPFRFEHDLSFEYCVGRLPFTDDADLATYAAAVVRHEEQARARAPRVTLFGTRHAGDAATERSSTVLLDELRGRLGDRATSIIGADALKQRLIDELARPTANGGAELIFSATHGIGLPRTNPDQRQVNGALLCQDWTPGQPPRPADYLAATDIDDRADLAGKVVFAFACYGAGTPQRDQFPVAGAAAQIADEAFVAALPRRLLSHPRAPLAVIGHVERAWACSIGSSETTSYTQIFDNAIQRMLAGEPVGFAMRDFRERCAVLSARMVGGATATVAERFERADAEGYAVLGDPAARLLG